MRQLEALKDLMVLLLILALFCTHRAQSIMPFPCFISPFIFPDLPLSSIASLCQPLLASHLVEISFLIGYR